MSHGEVKLIDGKRVATPEYRSWQMMKHRCQHPQSHGYKKPLSMIRRWNDFDLFLTDMGRRPTIDHTLERRNNNKGYSKSNCYWATRKQQARNRGTYHTCSLQMADQIRELYATGQYRQIDLADWFGLTQAHISQITRNVCWARD